MTDGRRTAMRKDGGTAAVRANCFPLPAACRIRRVAPLRPGPFASPRLGPSVTLTPLAPRDYHHAGFRGVRTLPELPPANSHSPRRTGMDSYIVRGILIGGSLGVFAALLGLSDSIPRAFGVGMIGGFLAGITLERRRRK